MTALGPNSLQSELAESSPSQSMENMVCRHGHPRAGSTPTRTPRPKSAVRFVRGWN